jgi:hypothetical protein
MGLDLGEKRRTGHARRETYGRDGVGGQVLADGDGLRAGKSLSARDRGGAVVGHGYREVERLDSLSHGLAGGLMGLEALVHRALALAQDLIQAIQPKARILGH